MKTRHFSTLPAAAVRLLLALALLVISLSILPVPRAGAVPKAQSAPAAVTEAATGVTSTAATLNGVVTANNSSTYVTFEYGLSTSYGRIMTADPNPIEGAIPTAVSLSIAELLPGTTYHYRVVAENEYGPVYGDDMTLTTALAGVPTAITGPASNVTLSGATLNGTVNAQGERVTTSFEYGSDTSYGTTVTAVPGLVEGMLDTAVSATLGGLLPNTTYHYRVVALYGGGTVYGADQSFTTGASAASVTTGAATGVQAGTVVLNGLVNPGGADQVVWFEWGLTRRYERIVEAVQSPVSGSGAIAVSATISSLIPNTTYYYRVVAQAGSDPLYGTDQSLTTLLVPPTATTHPASSVTSSGATLNGAVNPGGTSTTVVFQYGLTTAYGNTVTASTSPLNGTGSQPASAAIAGLTDQTIYHYRVVAQNANGTVYGDDVAFVAGTTLLPAATTEAVVAVFGDSAILRGTVNAAGAGARVTFQYGLDAGYGREIEVAPVSGTSDTAVLAMPVGLTLNTTYHYRVVLQNVLGTVYGEDMTFTTAVPAPTAVTGSASDVTAAEATLSGTVNGQYDLTTVTFEYGLTATYGSTVTARPVTAYDWSETVVRADLTGLEELTLYHYRVVAQNAGGIAYGADQTFTTGILPDAITTVASDVWFTTATLNGVVNAQGTSTIVFFEYGLDTSYGTTTAAEPGLVSGDADTPVSKMLTGLLVDTTYHYRVVARNANGTAYGADQTLTTLLGKRYLPLVVKAHVPAPDLVVQRIGAAAGDVQVVIANVGSAPAVGGFWVDLYVNPPVPPTAANQTWPTQGCSEGVAWGVTQDLAPGDVLTLTLSSPYLDATHTHLDGLAAGDVLYAQVDSAGSSYGAIRESHEIAGGAYNNILSFTVTSASGAAAPKAGATPIERDRLPERP